MFFDICLHIKLDCGFEGHLKCIILDINSISASTASHNACRVYTSLYTCSWACPACTTSRCYEFDLKGRENQCSYVRTSVNSSLLNISTICVSLNMLMYVRICILCDEVRRVGRTYLVEMDMESKKVKLIT